MPGPGLHSSEAALVPTQPCSPSKVPLVCPGHPRVMVREKNPWVFPKAVMMWFSSG